MFCPDLKTAATSSICAASTNKGLHGDRPLPDQYVAHILPFDAYDELAEFFAGVLLPQV